MQPFNKFRANPVGALPADQGDAGDMALRYALLCRATQDRGLCDWVTEGESKGYQKAKLTKQAS